MSRRGAVLFLALSVMWGIPYLLIREAVQHGVDPATLVFLRTAPAAAILLPVAWRAGALRAVRGHLGWVVVYAFVHFGVPWLLMSSAEQHLTSPVTGMLVATVPLIAAVVARVTHPDERFGAARLAGLALGAVGVGLAVGFDLAGSNGLWLLAMGVVVLGYTFGPVIISLRLGAIGGLGVIATAFGVVSVAYAPYALTHLPGHWTWSIVGSIAVLAIVCTGAAFLVMFELVGEVGPSRMVVVTYLNTAIAVILGIVVLSEPLTTGIVVGFPLIIGGSYLATARRPSLSEAPQPAATSPRRSWRRAPRPARTR